MAYVDHPWPQVDQGISLESIFALTDKSNKPIWLERKLPKKLAVSRNRRTLRYLTSLASICVREKHETYAAASYTSGIYEFEGLTIVLSGSAPIPAATRIFVETVVIPQLRRTASDPALSLRTSAGYETSMTNLLYEVTLFAFEYWKQCAHVDALDVWHHRAKACRQSLEGEDIDTFDVLVMTVDYVKSCARFLEDDTRSSHTQDDRRLFYTANHQLDGLLLLERTRQMLQRVDKDVLGVEDTRRLLDPSSPIINEIVQLETQGRSEPKFSFTRYAISVVANFRHAEQLLVLAQSQPQLFEGTWPAIAFCDSQYQEVVIDSKVALEAVNRPGNYVTNGATSAAGFPHAAVNLLHNLVDTASTSAVTISPVIGCSTLLCIGCRTFFNLFNHNRYQITRPRISGIVPDLFHHPGTSGQLAFPWLCPDFSAIDRGFDKLMRQHMVMVLKSSLREHADRDLPSAGLLYARAQIARMAAQAPPQSE